MTSKLKIPVMIFLSLEAFLYWDMMSLHLLEPGPWFQYLSILLCLVFLVVFRRPTIGWVTVAAAMLFACAADFFLVILQDHRLVGTAIFVLTQSGFAVRLFWEDWNRRGRFAAMRVLLFVGLEFTGMIVAEQAFDGLLFVVLLYFSLQIGNVIHALFLWKNHPLFGIGLILFVFCDIAVGLSTSEAYLQIAEGSLLDILLNAGVNWAWLFYVPAQVLITMSVYAENRQVPPVANA